MSVERSSVGGGNFWGLVQQKGPWKTTKMDLQNSRSSMKQDKVSGGGIGEGGTSHAGHGNYKQFINPGVISGRDAPPPPSKLAMRSVVTIEVNHYRKKAVAGMLPIYTTLGEHSAAEAGGQKAGGMGAPLTTLIPLHQTTVEQEEDVQMMPSTPIEMPSASFLTEHRLEEEQVKEEVGIRALPSHPLEFKAPGVIRKPRQKVTMKPYAKVSPKLSNVEKARALMAKREKEKEGPVTTAVVKSKAPMKPVGQMIKPIKRKPETNGNGSRKKTNTKNVPVFNPLKRKAETGGEGSRKKTAIPIVNPLKRKAETGGAGPRKKVAKPKLQVTTTGLPPPVQRFGAGKKEEDSKPKKFDRLPLPTKRQIALKKK
jgi:hypothetical protein